MVLETDECHLALDAGVEMHCHGLALHEQSLQKMMEELSLSLSFS
jgi:hypothetical protein